MQASLHQAPGNPADDHQQPELLRPHRFGAEAETTLCMGDEPERRGVIDEGQRRKSQRQQAKRPFPRWRRVLWGQSGAVAGSISRAPGRTMTRGASGFLPVNQP